MCGKKLVKNLVSYLTPLFDCPVYAFDSNQIVGLPRVVVGVESEEMSRGGMLGHYTCSGFVMIGVHGREDEGNTLADTLADEAIEALCDRTALEGSLNLPAGTDERPAADFHLNRLFVRGTERENQESSTFVFVRFDAFCRNSD